MHRHWLRLLPILPLGVACEDLDAGRLEEDSAPPKLLRILIQDEVRTGGRFQVTDLLNTAPDVSCSLINPCPATLLDPSIGAPVECSYEEEGAETGTCLDPTKPQNTPPQVGTPVEAGGVQIRLVFSKGLDRTLDQTLPAGAIASLSVGGETVEAAVYLDPGGDPSVTSDAIREPYGPAVVIKPAAPLISATEYTVHLDASQIKDRAGQAATSDLAGAIKSEYTFTTEAFHLRSSSQDFLGGAELLQNEAIQLEVNADFDPAGPGIQVRTSSASFPVTWFADCDLGPRIINVLPIDENGDLILWPEGEYTFEAPIKDLDGQSSLQVDPFGSAPMTGSFTVVSGELDPDESGVAFENIILPEECE